MIAESLPSAASALTCRRRYSAFPHRPRHCRQQLGEVAADLTLDADRHDRPGEVLAVEPLRNAVEGVFQRDPDPGLDEHALELTRDRLLSFPRDRVHGLGK